MALPSSGQLSLSQIGTELSITAGNQASLRAMSATAGFTSPDPVTEFYGYSATEDILTSWGSQGTPSTTSTTFDWWRIQNLAGLSSATIRPRLSLVINSVFNATVTMYSGLSSSGPWYSLGSRSSAGTSLFYVSTSTVATGANTLYIRQYISRAATGSVTGSFNVLNQYTLVSGTVDSYGTTGTTSWAVSF